MSWLERSFGPLGVVLLVALGTACGDDDGGDPTALEDGGTIPGDGGGDGDGDGDGDDDGGVGGDGDGDGDGDAGSADAGSLPISSSTAAAVIGGGACPTRSGAGTEHNATITEDETWTAEDSPHRIDSAIRISADVTIEPCATVLLGKGVTVQVGGGQADEAGSLTTLGTVDDAGEPLPVIFDRSGSSNWGSIRVERYGTADFNVTALLHAAHPDSAQNGGGALLVIGNNDGKRLPSVRANVLVIDGSAGYGVNLQTGGAFKADSAGVIVQNSGSVDAPEPVWIDTPGVGSLPSGLYTGNELDEIAVNARLVVREDETFPARGVPYRIASQLSLVPETTGEITTLTVEAGVTLKLEDRVVLGDGGGSEPLHARIIAQGSAEEPILFTSAQASPEPGDWVGIYMSAIAPTGNVMDHVIVEYAGGDSQTRGFGCGALDNDAALIILYEKPDEAFITSSTFRNNAGETTIVSGWEANSGVNLVSGNTFENTGGSDGGCLQSLWRTTGPDYCPDGEGPHCVE